MELYNVERLKEPIKFNSAHFYVFYPVKKQMVIGMGVNKRYRMGKCKEDKIPTIVTSTTDLNAV